MADLEAMIATLWLEARPRLLERVQALEAAWDAGDRQQAAVEAHTLAGTLGSFGRRDATEAARAAERALADGDEVALAAAIRSLRAEMTR
jgi:HPt (histidine-containing phosphotransfer) domain-containing protein